MGICTSEAVSAAAISAAVQSAATNKADQCNINGGNGAYLTDALNFDATNDYVNRGSDLIGNADSKVGIMSFWFNTDVLTNLTQLYNSLNNRVIVQHNFSGYIDIQLYNTLGGLILNPLTTAPVTADVWNHILFAWDVATGDNRMFLNDVQVWSSTTTNAENFDYTSAGHAFGSRSSGAPSQLYNGCLSDFYINYAETLDLSIVSNRRKFIDETLKPVDLGSSGQLVTGTSPIIFMKGNASTWNANLGSGGGFTLNGAPALCASSPTN